LNDSFDISSRLIKEDDEVYSSSPIIPLLKTKQPKGKQHSDFKRAEKIFQSLDDECTADEARRSLLVFRNMYAIKMKMRELKTEIPPTLKGGEEVKSFGSSGGISAGQQKINFIERFRGRKSSGRNILIFKG
jgi:hypothetical protein